MFILVACFQSSSPNWIQAFSAAPFLNGPINLWLQMKEWGQCVSPSACLGNGKRWVPWVILGLYMCLCTCDFIRAGSLCRCSQAAVWFHTKVWVLPPHVERGIHFQLQMSRTSRTTPTRHFTPEASDGRGLRRCLKQRSWKMWWLLLNLLIKPWPASCLVCQSLSWMIGEKRNHIIYVVDG